MGWYRNILFGGTFLYSLSVYIHAQTVDNSTQTALYSEYCPSHITIHSKRYFESYLKIWQNGSTSGIFPPLLTENVSATCCNGQNISIKFVNETSRISVKKLLFTEREKREKSGKDFDNTTLDFYFPVYTKESEATKVYRDFYFIEVVQSPGPAFVVLVEDLKEAPDPSLVLIECWPIFVLLLVMAWVVGIIGWFLVSICIINKLKQY